MKIPDCVPYYNMMMDEERERENELDDLREQAEMNDYEWYLEEIEAKGENSMRYLLYYDGLYIGQITTNLAITLEEMLDSIGFNEKDFVKQHNLVEDEGKLDPAMFWLFDADAFDSFRKNFTGGESRDVVGKAVSYVLIKEDDDELFYKEWDYFSEEDDERELASAFIEYQAEMEKL